MNQEAPTLVSVRNRWRVVHAMLLCSISFFVDSQIDMLYNRSR